MFCNISLILFHIYLSVDKPELMAMGQFHRWNFRYRPTQILSKVTNNYKKKAFGSEAKCFLFVVIYFADCPHREKALASLPLYIRHIQQSDDPRRCDIIFFFEIIATEVLQFQVLRTISTQGLPLIPS